MDPAEVGRRGERAAALYYIQRGCTLLEHNYRIRGGEIDLILRTPEGHIVICEGKTRTNPNAVCRPSASVTRAKQRRLIRAARYYLSETNQQEAFVHFDVAEVTPLDSGRWMVHIIKRAFDASERNYDSGWKRSD